MIVSEKDGFGNTRPKSNPQLSVHLDYLRIILKLPLEDLDVLLNFVGYKYIGIRPEIPWTAGAGSMWYENTITSPEGINGGYTIDSESNTVDVMLDFSGQYFSGKSVTDQWRILQGLKYRFDADCSRIDLAIDDPTYSLIPVVKMREEANRGNNFRFKNYRQVASGKCGEKLTITDYYGSRNSGKMVRVYDHKQVCMRFECELKRGYSRAVFNLLATTERKFIYCIHAIRNSMDADMTALKKEYGSDCMDAMMDWYQLISNKHINIGSELVGKCFENSNGDFEVILQKIIGSIAVSAIDFRDKSKFREKGNASYRDTSRLDFYQEFMDLLGGEIKINAPRKESKIENAARWLGRQASKTMYIFKQALTVEEWQDFMFTFFKKGEEKMTLADYKVVSYLRDNPGLLKI